MKNILLNSDTSHLDLYHQSNCLFAQIRLHLTKYLVLSTAIRNYDRHAQRTIKMSRILSHSASIFLHFKQLFKEETHVKVFFCLLPVGMCIDEYVTIHSNVLCVCSLINYTLATEENILNVRVCP